MYKLTILLIALVAACEGYVPTVDVDEAVRAEAPTMSAKPTSVSVPGLLITDTRYWPIRGNSANSIPRIIVTYEVAQVSSVNVYRNGEVFKAPFPGALDPDERYVVDDDPGSVVAGETYTYRLETTALGTGEPFVDEVTVFAGKN